MTTVHQAIYGDKEGSYALLKTSLADTELAKRICNATDLLDRPSSGYLTQSVFRGFALSDYYIFIKSFPDNDPSVRQGRVLSHTLIVDLEDLHRIADIAELFSYFLSKPDKNPELNSIVLDNKNLGSNENINETSREAAAINGLLHHSEYNDTLVWVGEENYISFIAQLWRQLEGNLRATLNIGVGFNPQKVDTQKINILYVLEGYENKWVSSDFCIVGKEEIGTLESMSSFRLAGQRDKSKPLDDLIKMFGIAPDEVEDYEYIEKVVSTYNNLSTKTEFNSLIVLCDLIAKYSPNPKVAKVEKDKILKHVMSRIDLATANQILKLKNVEWKGFVDAQRFIGKQMIAWIEKSLFELDFDASILSLITSAFDPNNKAEWWKKAFVEGLETELKSWKSNYSASLWGWFLAEPNLVITLKEFIPVNVQVEKDFVNHWQKPERELAKNIQVFSKDRKWLILHGLSTLQLYDATDSIRKQLEIDIEPDNFIALNRMGKLISDEEFIRLTLEIEEPRLIKIAGEKVTRTPSLIGQLDVKNIVWRQIWLESIELGMQPYDAIKKPDKVLFELLEEVVNGVDIEAKLLLMFSKSNYNDLSSFKPRAKVWLKLDEVIKSGFIVETTLGCVRLIDDGNINVSDLEDDIRICLSSTDTITRIIRDQAISVAAKILLFKELPELKENELLGLLNAVLFSQKESKDIGKLITNKHWSKAASAVARNISSRNDLKLALKECQSLLGCYEKLRLSWSGYLLHTISDEEWWDEFSIQCYTKYTKGPTDKGLWGRADGENYDLHTTGSGREIWMDVIRKIQNKSSDVDVLKLLQEMLKDFPNSDELKQLRKAYNNHE